jgi:hypothetical protein
MRQWLALAALLLAVPALALAEEPQGPTQCAQVRKKDPRARCKDLKLDGDDVDGAIAKGDGDLVPARVPVKWGSLIKVRLSMMDKLVKSAENVTH